MEWLANPEVWVSFATLAILEIVLGIDNLIFISIISEKLPKEKQPMARRLGLIAALVARVILLFAITWVVTLTEPFVELFDHPISVRDLLLLAGGLFLIAKATTEIHGVVEGDDLHDSKATGGKKPRTPKKVAEAMAGVMVQILLLDLVFSLDSILTAVGMTRDLPVMIAAISLAIVVMMFAADPVANFVQRHPTVKMLALSFLVLIGMTLVADGFHFEIPKGYIYFAVGYAIGVEALNFLAARRRKKARA